MMTSRDSMMTSHTFPRLYKHPLHDDPKLEEMYELCEKKNTLAIKCKDTKQELRDARTGTLFVFLIS